MEGAAITPGPDTLCDACIRKLQRQLDDLPTIRDVLYGLYLTRGGESGEAKVSSSTEPQPPFNVHTMDLVDEIDDVMDRTDRKTIESLVCEPEMQFKLWRGGGWKMDYLDGVQRALEVGFVWRKADGIIGITPKWQQRMAKCPHCNTRTLGNFAGSDTIICSSCGQCMTREEYETGCVVVSKIKDDLWQDDDVPDLPTPAGE
jgi:hypothetical protein